MEIEVGRKTFAAAPDTMATSDQVVVVEEYKSNFLLSLGCLVGHATEREKYKKKAVGRRRESDTAQTSSSSYPQLSRTQSK